MSIAKVLSSATIFIILHRIDLQLAELVRNRRCRYCGGPLHYARFERKPAGAGCTLDESLNERQGLCCGSRECRRRTLPPSSLFLGRKVTYRCAILVFLLLRHNRDKPMRELSAMLDVDIRTFRRWIAEFRDEYPVSEAWQKLRGFVECRIRNDQLPGALLNFFLEKAQDAVSGIVECIRFMLSGETDLITITGGVDGYAEDVCGAF